MNYNTTCKGSSQKKEDNDCAVHALAIICDIDYLEAHADLYARGRANKHGLVNDGDHCIELNEAIEAHGFTVTRLKKSPAKTLKSFQKFKNKERFLIYSGGKVFGANHVSAYKNGLLEDWAANKQKPICSVWLVRKK